MSQQYPGQHPNSSRAGMLPTGYAPTYIHGSIPQVGPHGHHPITSPHMHPDPSQLPPMALQRSMSTPDTRGLFQAGHDTLQTISSGERRRNKLGYHRTSVACGHCRRRKIRCIPSQSDSLMRCINCIRLKKDCSFIPQDQQQPSTSRAKSSASTTAERQGSTPTSSRTGSQDPGDSATQRSTSITVSPAAARSASQDIQPVGISEAPRGPNVLKSAERLSVTSDRTDPGEPGVVTSNAAAKVVSSSGGGESWSREPQVEAHLSPYGQTNMYSVWPSNEGNPRPQGGGYWNLVAQPGRSLSFSNDSTAMAAQGSYMSYSQRPSYSQQPPFNAYHPPPIMMESSPPPNGELPSQQHLMWQQSQQPPYQGIPAGLSGWPYQPQMGAPPAIEESVATGDGSHSMFNAS